MHIPRPEQQNGNQRDYHLNAQQPQTINICVQPAPSSRDGRNRAAARYLPSHGHRQHIPVAKEAWMLRLMDVENFQHIRALPPEELRALLAAFKVDDSSIGIRDRPRLRPWGWTCVTLSKRIERSGYWEKATRKGSPHAGRYLAAVEYMG